MGFIYWDITEICLTADPPAFPGTTLQTMIYGVSPIKNLKTKVYPLANQSTV